MALQKRFVAKAGLDNNNQTLTNVADPVNAQDVSTRNFSSNANNLSAGTLAAARLPAFSGGDVTSSAGSAALTLANSGVTAGNYGAANSVPVLSIDAKGRVTAATPTPIAIAAAAVSGLAASATTDTTNASNIASGTLAAARLADSGVTAATVNNSATALTPITVDAKGRITATGAAVTITPAFSSITGKPTTLSGYGITDAIPASQKGVANGVATLDATGLIPSSQLPSYVDDVIEAANLAAFPATGETGKIYVALDTNRTYRWSGTVYTLITSGAVDSVNSKTGVVTLTTSDIAEGTNQYFTNARASAAAPVQSVAGRTGEVVLAKGDVGLGNVANVDTTNASNISSGTLGAARLPQFTGGDVTTGAAGSVALTLANSGVTAGSYGSATVAPVITVDAKGRVTAASTQTITPAFSSITGKPTTLSGYGITDAVGKTDNSLPVTQGNHSSATLTTSTSAANQVVDSVAAATYRTAKWLVQITSGTAYHSTEVLVVHDGTTVSMVEYGTVFTGPSLGTLDADISGGNLRLLISPTNATNTIKVLRTAVNV